jgi:hypothetical protein
MAIDFPEPETQVEIIAGMRDLLIVCEECRSFTGVWGIKVSLEFDTASPEWTEVAEVVWVGTEVSCWGNDLWLGCDILDLTEGVCCAKILEGVRKSRDPPAEDTLL